MPRLMVNPGTPSEWELPLKAGVNLIGRNSGSDVPLEHGSISGRHCEITLQGDALLVRDLGSTNGTFIDSRPVTEGRLAPGQRLQLGSVELQLLDDAPVRAVTPGLRLAGAEPVPVIRPVAAGAGPAPGTASVPAAPPLIRLHVTPHEAPPALPPPPTPMLADEYSMPVEGPVMCKYHPKSPAGWLCPQCGLSFCDLCVSTRQGGTRTGKFCRRCGVECVARQIQMVPDRVARGNFFERIGSAFLYPLRGAGLWFIIAGGLTFAVLDYLAGFMGLSIARLAKNLFVYGYLFAFVEKMVQTAAQGSDEPPSWPEFSEWVSDILIPYWHLLAISVVCFGPALGMTLWAGADFATTGTLDYLKLGTAGALGLAGLVYFPMAVLAVSMFDTVSALNPLLVVPAIFKVPLPYLVLLVMAGTIVGVRIAETLLLPFVPIPLLPQIASTLLNFYLLMAQMRLLGLMYYCHREQFGWFSRH